MQTLTHVDPVALAVTLSQVQRVAARWRAAYEDGDHTGEPSAEQAAAEQAARAAGATEDQVSAAWDRGVHWGPF
ncbi:hypothetical protein [Nocardia farcinica]|uniref:hypothetical protein n=1 Tax=Nocardia farcinica TaxID=37329 RepID=UPI002455DB89|nr:hypothetical protein [Nocardia farcinica]